MAKNYVRYCHSNHVLHMVGSSKGECQQLDSGYAPETVLANNDSMNEDVGVVYPPASVNVLRDGVLPIHSLLND